MKVDRIKKHSSIKMIFFLFLTSVPLFSQETMEYFNENYKVNITNIKTTSEAQYFQEEINFKKVLESGKINDKIDLHKNLYENLLHLSDNKSLFNDLRKENMQDYKFFFKKVIPKFFRVKKNYKLTAKNIIFKIENNKRYIANINFKGIDNKNRHLNTYVEFTGTYTSPYKYPTGLSISKGSVINPVVKNWDGLIVIGEGKLSLHHLNLLKVNSKLLDIRTSYSDYMLFTKYAQKKNLSIIQTHLLVSHGINQINVNSKRIFRRRALIQTDENTIILLDTLNMKLSLYDFAYLIASTYKVKYAVNLDMGAYDYGFITMKNRQYKFGLLDNKRILSNTISFTY